MFPSHDHASILDPRTGLTLTWGMHLEDYEPIKVIGERPVIYGPWPRPYATRSWCFGQDAWYFPDEGIDSLEHLNKEELQAKQREVHRVYRQYEAMREAQMRLDETWYRKYNPYKRHFYRLMDSISTWGCYQCEAIDYRKMCVCHDCEGCGSKYCDGCDPDGYDSN